MGLNDTLKCPGMDKTLSTFPIEFDCPQCNAIVEIWSDELKCRCTQCGTVVFNPDPSVKKPDPKTFESKANPIDELLELAMDFGSSAVTILDADHIQIDNQIADLCRETKCPNYGSSPTCPPHVRGPDWLKNNIHKTSQAIMVEIEVPQEQMYSDKRKEISKLLHFIVIQIERAAHEKGLVQSTAFAGGSCKNIQCSEHSYCNFLNGDGICRHPDLSRPSVSGYGINMNHLLKNAGWFKKSNNSFAPTSSHYGLVLIG
ncbi:DUF2284 domain-containing protein [Desulfopila sp. IMCC35008]|uniref:DUF2284 domain-containing protein n=1 Tax=Desulfopila sp. IMCC35008 TaxID=2653858 RepID=UPI0013D06145|nr:DUF2284 domain-containing protein [Desulfopila sp. IMCC35008]